MFLPQAQRVYLVLVVGITVTTQIVFCTTSWSRISNAIVNDLLSENLRQPIISLPGYHGKETRQKNTPPFERNDECSRNLTDLYIQSSGTIRTPNYPDNYPSLSQCEWVLESEPGTVIQATFFDVVTQPWSIFFFDYVTVSDTGDWDEFYRFTGDLNRIMPYTVVSKSNKLSVRFVSSYLLNFRGFKMSYVVRPERNLTEASTVSIDEEGNMEDNVLAAICDYSPISAPPEQDSKLASLSSSRPSNSDSKPGLWSSNKQNFQRGNSVHRIVGGSEVTPHQYPFMAALLMDDKYFCGGSLIDRQHVLTAAHCVDGASKVEVFMGSHDLTEEEDSRQYQSVNSSYVLQHPGFDSKTGANDIAIIRLAELVTFDRHVQPVFLPSPESMSNSFTGYKLITMGWGEANKSRENPSISPVLRKASASIIPNSVCKQTFKDVITGNVMCSSGSRGDSPCHGDSGSPLVAEFRSFHNLDSTNSTNHHHQCVYSDPRKSKDVSNGTNWFVQLGLLSIGSSSCGSSAPTAFTRVTAYIDFIRHAQTLTLKNFKN